ncbi:hypothetical protein BH20ACI2_BH20ACI2_09200 [soil metagenome]
MYRFLRKSICLVLLGILLPFESATQIFGLPKPFNGLSGKPHTIREERFSCSGDADEKPWRVSEVEFDRQGNVIARLFRQPDGSIGHQSRTTYNDKGEVRGWKEFYGASDFPPSGLNKHAVFTFSGGKLRQVRVFRENKLEFDSTHTYNDSGKYDRSLVMSMTLMEILPTNTVKK